MELAWAGCMIAGIIMGAFTVCAATAEQDRDKDIQIKYYKAKIDLQSTIIKCYEKRIFELTKRCEKRRKKK